jgi:hypothetical protein
LHYDCLNAWPKENPNWSVTYWQTDKSTNALTQWHIEDTAHWQHWQ